MVMQKQLKAIHCEVAPTHVIKIYIAGDRNLARQVLQKYVMKGLCVSISEEEYIYTMGNETGIVVNLINYPRFPKTSTEMIDEARKLAEHLIEELHQGSCTIVDYHGHIHVGDSYFISRRPEDLL